MIAYKNVRHDFHMFIIYDLIKGFRAKEIVSPLDRKIHISTFFEYSLVFATFKPLSVVFRSSFHSTLNFESKSEIFWVYID